MPHPRRLCLFPIALLFWSSAAAAQEAPGLSAGDTAWIITATALVLFMTLPGLALFYGGLRDEESAVRADALLSICCLVSVLWLVVGYSLAFSAGGPVIGGLERAFLAGAGTDGLTGTIPEVVFFMFQMTFAIITPALIVGAYPERITFLRSPVQRRLAAPGLCPGRALDLGRRRLPRSASWTLPAAWSCISPRGRPHWSWRW